MEYEETYRELLCALYEEMIDDYIDSSLYRTPLCRIGIKSPPVPVRIHPKAHIFQQHNKCRLRNG